MPVSVVVSAAVEIGALEPGVDVETDVAAPEGSDVLPLPSGSNEAAALELDELGAELAAEFGAEFCVEVAAVVAVVAVVELDGSEALGSWAS